MLRLTLLLFAFLLVTFSNSDACRIAATATNSKELVTLKFGSAYFLLPENAFETSPERVPREVKERLGIERITTPSGKVFRVLLAKKATPREQLFPNEGRSEVPFNEELIILDSTPHLGDSDIAYLKTLTTRDPPATWERDLALVKRLNLDKEPCSGSGVKASEPLPRYVDEEVQEGLLHRNQAVRAAAIRQMRLPDASPSGKSKEILLNLAHNDEAEAVRANAVSAIRRLLKKDGTLADDLTKIAKKDPIRRIRWMAEQALKGQ